MRTRRAGTTRPLWARLIGLVMVVPAVVLMMRQYLIPTARTVMRSASWENYTAIAPHLPAALTLVGASALTFAVLGLLGGGLGVAAGRGSRTARRAAAAIAGIMVGWHAPAGMAMVYDRQHPGFGASLPEVVTVLGLVWAPVLIGAAALVVMIIVRSGQRVARSAVVVVVVGAFAALAGGLQSYGVLMSVGRMVASDTVALQPVAVGLAARGAHGPASAIESIVLGIVAILGVAAVALLVAVGARPMLTSPEVRTSTLSSHLWVGWAGAAGLGAVAIGCVVAHRHWFAGLITPLMDRGVLPDGWATDIWGPAIVAAVIQLSIAAVAGAGLALLRPFGGGSRWVLLLFAPWVYVGAAPLLIHNHLADQPGINWVNLPAVVAFTLLFAALANAHRRAADGDVTGQTRSSAIVTALAASLLVGLILVLINVEPLPQLLNPGSDTVTAVPVVVLASLVMGVLAVLVTDRLTMQTGPAHSGVGTP